MKTMVTVTIEEMDADFPEEPTSQRRAVNTREVAISDGPPPIDQVSYIAGVAVGKCVTSLKQEREMHPRDTLAPVES